MDSGGTRDSDRRGIGMNGLHSRELRPAVDMKEKGGSKFHMVN